VANRSGLNTFQWNLRYPDAVTFQNLIMWAAGTQGPIAPPGTYSVRLTVGNDVQTHRFRVLKDPRSTATDADLQAQFRTLIAIRDKVTEANNAVRTVRNMRWQVEDRTGRLQGDPRQRFTQIAGGMMDSLTSAENDVYQTRNQSGQDPLNYPIKLNNKIAALSGVVGAGEYRPTQQALDAFTRLSRELDVELSSLKGALDANLPRLNEILRAAGLPELKPSTDEPPPRRPNVAMWVPWAVRKVSQGSGRETGPLFSCGPDGEQVCEWSCIAARQRGQPRGTILPRSLVTWDHLWCRSVRFLPLRT
jgi:hypothetical protein